MIEENSKIKKGPAKRNPASYQVLQDIVIPKGTILRCYDASSFAYKASVGTCGTFSITDEHRADVPGHLFRKVIGA